jgi:G6PDH family F420-dependent oxidoreductase
MLEEAIEVIRLLWSGGQQSYEGAFYEVENARLYTLPESPPPLLVAASGPKAAELAGRVGDGLVTTAPDQEVLAAYDEAGGAGTPRYGQVTVCWAETEAAAVETAYRVWPNAAITGELGQELPTPAHFEQAAKIVGPEEVAQKVTCGPDPERHVAAIREYADAGIDHIYLHQVGPDQEGFFRFYQTEILPRFR